MIGWEIRPVEPKGKEYRTCAGSGQGCQTLAASAAETAIATRQAGYKKMGAAFKENPKKYVDEFKMKKGKKK